MSLRSCLLLLLLHIPVLLYGQQKKNRFSIYISDNHNIQNEAYIYSITKDSLVITGIADYGKSNIDYLRRKLNTEEKKNLQEFMLTFPVNKFNELYFKDYANLGYITNEHFPRVIDMDLTNLGSSKKVRINNIYIAEFARLFNMINPMLPDEVKIRYEEKDFQ